MKIFRILTTLTLLFGLQTQLTAAEVNSNDYKEQLHKIILFYETLDTKEPKVSDFVELFGKDNEAELELILRQDFPSLNLQDQNWDLNPEVANHVDNVFIHADSYASKFFECIKSNNPKLFAPKNKHQIEFPPKIDSDFRRFTVSTAKVKDSQIIFEFSQNEPYIESIILPNGKSIYTLTEKCKKTKNKKN